eukprot:4903263-Pyramimonas_sp.AAC.1
MGSTPSTPKKSGQGKQDVQGAFEGRDAPAGVVHDAGTVPDPEPLPPGREPSDLKGQEETSALGKVLDEVGSKGHVDCPQRNLQRASLMLKSFESKVTGGDQWKSLHANLETKVLTDNQVCHRSSVSAFASPHRVDLPQHSSQDPSSGAVRMLPALAVPVSRAPRFLDHTNSFSGTNRVPHNTHTRVSTRA